MTLSNKEFYAQSIKEFGVSAEGVHWNNKYTQYKRFEILTKLIKKDIQTSSVVDVGCGFGEYYNYLKNNNKIPLLYKGIDCESTMIKVCEKRFSSLEFLQKDIVKDTIPLSDYYICSGALNILNKDEVKIFIEKCYKHSKKAFVFNYLKNITFNNIKKEEIIEFCSELSSNITLKEGYLDNDFTILMVK